MDSLLSGPYLTFGVILAFGAFAWMVSDLWELSRTDDIPGGTYRPPPRRKTQAGEAPEERRATASSETRAPPPGGRAAHQFSGAVETWIDRDTGDMRGRVMRGPMAGRTLESLSRMECLGLYELCQQRDLEAARLLAAYLTRRFGPRFDAKPRGERAGARQAPEGPLTRERALEVLGLSANAGRAQIVAAHRALIKKHHPDRGGSTATAAVINQAKDLLLASSP